MKRVVVTGMASISPIGESWEDVLRNLKQGASGVRYMPEWDMYDGLRTKLGAPAEGFVQPEHYTRKMVRSMGRVALMATRASELALSEAGLLDDPLLTSGKMGVAFGSSSGTPSAIQDFGLMMSKHSTSGITANTYVKMMPHTAAANIEIFFGLCGRVITTSSACTSGSQGIGFAYETIRQGKQVAMIAGGADELSATQAAVFDTLYATSTQNSKPTKTPKPFDLKRDGLVIGEGAATLILEELEHALARGAKIIAEVVGFGTNSDGSHITQPNQSTMSEAMLLALSDQDTRIDEIGYVSAHGTATDRGDIAESHATIDVIGAKPISSLKSYTGHTLGACGAMEAWMSIHMMREGWFHPTLNLDKLDPQCADLDYIVGTGRNIDCEYVMSNNFAFGGINTSLILRKLN